jgi:pilus assembly protein CpaB
MQAELERAFTPKEETPRRPAQGKGAKVSSESQEARAEVEPNFVPKVERRKNQRRGMDALRDEALRNVISRVEDKNFGGLRNQVRWGRGMPPSRILLLIVALLAGGLAAVLATQRKEPVAEPAVKAITEVVQEARTQILVAKGEIGIGQRLSPDSVGWVDWPEGAVRPDYITVAAEPEAVNSMAGSVARFEFFPGEPIREQKLAQPGQGFLSAVLDSGKRGVSVSVAAESASGGFVVPNDHVDVVLTRQSPTGHVSDTILHNVRVLAINARLGEMGTTGAPEDSGDPRADIFSDVAIATLELDPTEAELIINATTTGKLALVLVPTVDLAEPGKMEQEAANLAIRISSPFWNNSPGTLQ